MAITWFRKAADQGLAEAQYYVGLCFELGTGVNQDYLEAAKWFSLAAQQNLPEAQYMLGVFSEEGLVKKPDLSEALDWYYEAAAGGYEPAKQTLKRFKVYTPNWFERLFGLY